MFRSRLARLALLLLAVPLLLLGSAQAASAEPAPRATGWTCDGSVCIQYVPKGAVTPAGSGCNFDTCVSVEGTTGGYSALGYADADYYGHIDLWGPGMGKHPGPDGREPTVSGNGKGAGAVCAEGWQDLGGGRWASRGLPCVQV